MVTGSDYRAYMNYVANRGNQPALTYEQWKSAGRPAGKAATATSALDKILAGYGAGGITTPVAAEEHPPYYGPDGWLYEWSDYHQDYIRSGYAPEQAQRAPTTPTMSYEDALARQQELGDEYRITYDYGTGSWGVEYVGPTATGEPTGYQREQLELQRQQLSAQEAYQQQQLEWQRQQWQQQLAAQREAQLAEKRAHPASWLEYHSLAGTTPVVQPWMVPLMAQEYQTARAGQALPGWTGGEERLTGLAELTTPSAQYLARMGPTARQQYYGYQQARTGAPAEETEWRLWSQAPPGGRFGGLRYAR